MSEPGFPGPRTALAWNRTALSAAALAALMLKLGLTEHRPLEVLASVCALSSAALVWLLARRRRLPPAEDAPPAERSPRAAANRPVALVAAFAVTTAVLTIGGLFT